MNFLKPENPIFLQLTWATDHKINMLRVRAKNLPSHSRHWQVETDQSYQKLRFERMLQNLEKLQSK